MRRARLAIVAGLMLALGAAAPVAAATGITSITMGVGNQPAGWVAPAWPNQFLGTVVSGSVSSPSQWTIDVTGSATSCDPVCHPPLVAKAEVVVDKVEPGYAWAVGQQVAAMELPDGHYAIGAVMDDYGLPSFTGPGAGYAEAAYVRALPQHPSGLSYTAIPGAPCGPSAPYVPCQTVVQAAPPSTTQASNSSAAGAAQPSSSTSAGGSSAASTPPASRALAAYLGGHAPTWAQCMRLPTSDVYPCLYGRFEQSVFRVRWSSATASRYLATYMAGGHPTPAQCASLPIRYVLGCDSGARPTAGAASIRPLVGIARGAGSEQCAVRPGRDAAGRPTLVVTCVVTVPAP